MTSLEIYQSLPPIFVTRGEQHKWTEFLLQANGRNRHQIFHLLVLIRWESTAAYKKINKSFLEMLQCSKSHEILLSICAITIYSQFTECKQWSCQPSNLPSDVCYTRTSIIIMFFFQLLITATKKENEVEMGDSYFKNS